MKSYSRAESNALYLNAIKFSIIIEAHAMRSTIRKRMGEKDLSPREEKMVLSAYLDQYKSEWSDLYINNPEAPDDWNDPDTDYDDDETDDDDETTFDNLLLKPDEMFDEEVLEYDSDLQKIYELYSFKKPERKLIILEKPKIITDIRLVSQKILERIKRNPYEMYHLTPNQFEIMCAELYEERGYKVILTPKTHDGGKDLIILNDNELGRFMIYGECKKNAPDNPVGVDTIRQFACSIWADNATAGIVMTSSYFSHGAKEFANRFKHQLSLMDFTNFQQMKGKRK